MNDEPGVLSKPCERAKMRDACTQLLRAGCRDNTANFREGQIEAIKHLVEGRGRLLVVQKTGWGKSFVYFIATKLLRDRGHGPTMLVSPLLALMRNQIAAAARMGVRAATINSDNAEEWANVERAIQNDNVDILLISPERLGNQRFIREVLVPVAKRIGLLVIDEAHCISDWGHDFRPHYRLIARILGNLPPNLRLLATTATANNRVVKDLQSLLGPNLSIIRGDLSRPSLFLQNIRLPDQAERMAWLAEHLPNLPGCGIVYTLTIRDAERLAEWLKSCNLNVEAYTSETGARREALERALLGNRVKALVATMALGMGFDKPDLAFVIHYQAPGSVVAYYQQVGRAGRAIPAAYGILLSGYEETEINEYFIDSAFPTRDEVDEVIKALDDSPTGLSVPELMRRVNLSKGRIEKTMQMLSLESPAPIVKEGAKWALTTADLGESFWERADRLTQLRRHEQSQMQEYALKRDGLMEFLIQALDGDTTNVCTAPLSPLPESVAPDLVHAANAFLRRSHLPIKPRAMWPPGGLPKMKVMGKIPEAFRAKEGRVLCLWGDAGWGELVRNGKQVFGSFSDQLVEATARMIREWNPQPAPTWLTFIPSRGRPGLVPDFARRISDRLGLSFIETLCKIGENEEQKRMKNSTQQARNVDAVFEVIAGNVRSEPLFLVDDMVDSGWTLTVATYQLLNAGSGSIYPVTLASTSNQ
jgi:ATP-dependent DNA helicase RecQ